MSAIQLLLEQLDDAWQHKWESLLTALDGITVEEAAWRASCYENEVRDAGWPAKGTILWHVAHVASSKRGYLEFIKQRTSKDVQYSTRFPEPSLELELEYLRKTQLELRRTVSSLSSADLLEKVSWCGEYLLLHRYISMIIRHDIWHAGQIRLLRRIWGNYKTVG